MLIFLLEPTSILAACPLITSEPFSILTACVVKPLFLAANHGFK